MMTHSACHLAAPDSRRRPTMRRQAHYRGTAREARRRTAGTAATLGISGIILLSVKTRWLLTRGPGPTGQSPGARARARGERAGRANRHPR